MIADQVYGTVCRTVTWETVCSRLFEDIGELVLLRENRLSNRIAVGVAALTEKLVLDDGCLIIYNRN